MESSFSAVSRLLRRLLQVQYLHKDAKADVEFILKLHASKEYRVDRYSPIVLFYPFLVNPSSPAGMTLRSSLKGYTGDLFQRLASEAAAELIDDGIEVEVQGSALPYPFAAGSIRRASQYLKEPLHSGDLLTALMIYPMDPDEAPLDAEREQEIYRLICQRKPLPHGTVSRADSEIASFLYDRDIDPSTVAMRLRGYAQPDDDPDNILARYSLAVGILESGRLKVQIVERWGKHKFAESEGMVAAPYGLWLPETVLFLPGEIEEFETLLNATPPVPEQAYQEFFEAHPKWLYLLGEQYELARSQVQLPAVQIYAELALTDNPVDEMWLRPDFLLKRVGLDLWDVLDIKASDCRMVVGRRSRRKFSEAVSEAIAQLREYARRLQQNEVRAYLRRKYQLTVSEPIAMVLVGRDFDFKTLQEKSMLRAREGVRVYTYDDLHRLARHRSLAF